MGDDELERAREIMDLVDQPGPLSESRCGCVWKRVKQARLRGVMISGDVLIKRCNYHAWLSEQPAEIQREISRFNR